jgi:uncharacterized protein YcbK (DUF882 family)
LIRALALIGAAAVLAPSGPARGTESARILAFFNTHTGERLRVEYRRGDDYVPEALAVIDGILRDHYSGDRRRIDPALFDYLYDLLAGLGYGGEVQIISGYRSERTNADLRGRGGGIAERSLHIRGRALDFRLSGVETRKLWEAARSLKRGGAGYYRGEDFVHIDTGRVRSW